MSSASVIGTAGVVTVAPSYVPAQAATSLGAARSYPSRVPTSDRLCEADAVPGRMPRGVARRVDAMRQRLAHRRQVLEAETDLDVPRSAPPPTDPVRVVVESEPRSYADKTHPVPDGVRAAADWSWRLLVIVAGLALVGWVAWEMRLVVFLVVVAGSLTIVGRAVGDQFGEVVDRAEEGLESIQDWLAGPPFNLSENQFREWIERAVESLGQNQEAITAGALSTATLAVEVVTGIVLSLFTLIFFLYDGDRIWAWLVRLFPRVARERIDTAGRLAWRTLTQYVRGTMLVALFDGTLITILLLVLGVPLALPLGVLVFFGAFIPLVGAFVTGALAVLVALVIKGVVAALIVLLGIIAIQQLEGHVFQPFVLGRMVRVHPLAVVIAVAAGAYAAGIIGAVIAVPLVAVANTVVSYLAGTSAGPPPQAPPASSRVAQRSPSG